MPKKLSLEESFGQLDEIIKQLETGQLTLEESFKYYEDGMKLIKKCGDSIDRVEKKLIVLEDLEES